MKRAAVVFLLLQAGAAAADLPDFAEVGPEEYRPMRRELRVYYPDECHERMRDPDVSNSFARIWSDVAAWFAAHPDADALDVRRENYRAMRRHHRPILFRESPFYFESGVAGGYAVRDVPGACAPGNVTRLLCKRFYHDRGFVPDEEFRVLGERSSQRYSYICGPFVDQIHNMPPFRKILENGFGGMKAKVEKALAECPAWDREGRRYLEVMLEGFDTVHHIQLAFQPSMRRLVVKNRQKIPVVELLQVGPGADSGTNQFGRKNLHTHLITSPAMFLPLNIHFPFCCFVNP